MKKESKDSIILILSKPPEEDPDFKIFNLSRGINSDFSGFFIAFLLEKWHNISIERKY